MAIIKSFAPFQNLSNFQTFLVDDNPLSEYFRIAEFKETFTGGKNGFLIEGSEFLKETTEVKIELLDVAGNPIYFEPGDGIPEYYEGTSKLVSVHVYDDTPIGLGKITILGELKNYVDTNGSVIPVPSEWKGIYNVKWQRTFKVNKNLNNEDIVRFYKRPLINIEELVKPIFSQTVLTSVDTGSVSGVPQLPVGGTNLSTWRAGTFYKLIKSSGSWDRDVDENVITIPSLNYSPTIIEVLNDREVLVNIPYSDSNNLVQPFVSQSFSVTYQDFANEVLTDSALTGSFAKIDITQLKTFVGDVARVKVFRKSRSSANDFQFVQESKLESTELLKDIYATGSTEIPYGRFDQYNLSTYWVTSSIDHPTTIDSSVLSQAVKVDYNGSGVQQLITSQSFSLSKDVEYTLDFRTLLSGSDVNGKSLKAYFSGSYTNTLGNPATYIQNFLTISGSGEYNVRQNVSQNILADRDIDAKLVFEFIGDDWYVSNVSLKNAQDTSFSPDEFTLIQDIPRKLTSETFDFRFEFYDINNNYIPVTVTATKEFNGGNDFPTSAKLLTFESDRNAFRFSTGSFQNPENQLIQFKVTQQNLTGSLTFASSAFDIQGNYLDPIEYTQYPGFLTNVTTAGALITINNFTGSRVDGFEEPYVGSIIYTASVDGLEEFETVYRLEDGDNAPQLIVTSTANQFIYEPTTLSPKPSGQSITIRASRKNLESLTVPITVVSQSLNSSQDPPGLTTGSNINGIQEYTISALEYSASFANSSSFETNYTFTSVDAYGNEYFDEITLSPVINFDGVSVVLSNEATAFAANSTGEIISSLDASSGSVQIFIGGNQILHDDEIGGRTKNTFNITSSLGTNVTPTDTTPNTSDYSISDFLENYDSGSLRLTIDYLAGDSITTQSFQKVVSYTKSKKAVPSVLTKVSPASQTINSGSVEFENPQTIEVFVMEGGNEYAYQSGLSGGLSESNKFEITSVISGSNIDEIITPTKFGGGTNGSAVLQYVDSEGTLVTNKTVRFDVGVSKIGKDGAGAANIEFFPQSQQLIVDIDGNYTPSPPSLINVSVIQGGTEYTYVDYDGNSIATTLTSNSSYTLTNATLCTFTLSGNVQPNSPAVNAPYTVTFDVTYKDNEGKISDTFTKSHLISIIADGSTGPGIVFTGPWESTRTYQYDLSNGRRDSVLYNGRYYASLQSGTNQIPAAGGTAYWQDLGTEDFFVAAKIAIFEESFIQNTLNIGANNDGALSSANITLYGGDNYPYFSLGQSSNVGTQGYSEGDGIFIGRDLDGEYKMSLENGTDSFLKWTGTTLEIKGNITATTGTISDTVTIGGTTAGNLLGPGDAAGDVNNNTTTISGNKIRTGNIQSNYFNGAEDGSNFSTAGSNFDLINGTITTPSFRIDTAGDAYFAGNISAGATISGASITGTNISGGTISGTTFSGATGTFTGIITAESGEIGGWSIVNNKIYTDNMSLNSGRSALEIYNGTSLAVDINSSTTLSSLGASAGNTLNIPPKANGDSEYERNFSWSSQYSIPSTVVTTTYTSPTTLSTSGLSGQTLVFTYDTTDDVEIYKAYLELDNLLEQQTQTYYQTVGYVGVSIQSVLELVSGGSVVASLTAYSFTGPELPLLGSTQGDAYTERIHDRFPLASPQSTTFTANGGTYSVRARTTVTFDAQFYASVTAPNGYSSQMTVEAFTAGFSNIRVFKEVSKTEVNAGGLQVVRSTTEYVIMDRLSSGTMLQVGGNITATGNITAYYSSDNRLKENIIPIVNPFDKINKIGGYEFDWKPEFEEIHNSKGHDVGLIAQEIQKSMPELVGEMAGGFLGVRYEKLTVYLLEAVKNLNNRLIELEDENKKLKEDN